MDTFKNNWNNETRKIINEIEKIFLQKQQSLIVGLLLGKTDVECNSLVCHDVTDEIVDEALKKVSIDNILSSLNI